MELACQTGQISLRVQAEGGGSESGWRGTRLVRAGELIHTTILDAQEQDLQLSGWHSTIYGHKIPALSFSIETQSRTPLRLESEWIFSENG